MLEVGKKEFWFVVGSQHLYGEEALQTVKNNAAVIVESLNNSGNCLIRLCCRNWR